MSSVAFAEDTGAPGRRPANWRGSTHVTIETDESGFTPQLPGADVSPIIYMNRCTGSCTIMASGTNDARANQSTVPEAAGACASSYPNCVISEYRTTDMKTGSNGKCKGGTAASADCTDATEATVCTGGGTCYSADDEWKLIMQCVREAYSPYAIQVTDVKPTSASYTMAIVAGKATEAGLSGVLGVAPVSGDCSPKDNVIAWSFANDHGANARVNNLCWTVAQETAHAFGLDHAFQFSDGTSACTDPLTYRFTNTDGTACGGQKFFRNKPVSCGEDMLRPCRCGGSQNSHLKLKNTFGDGTSLIPPPSATVTSPQPNATIAGSSVVTVNAGSKRGVEKVELFINGYKWAEVPGAKWRADGQPNPFDYALTIPAGVPDSIIDIKVVVSDDLGISTTPNIVTVTKGAPCASASTCAAGQKCEAGKCFWDPPVGVLGETCEFAQYCESGLCLETSDGKMCSQDCIVGAADACPMDYECLPAGNSGACVPVSDSGGCCSVGGGSNQVWFHLGISGLILGFLVRRRRKR